MEANPMANDIATIRTGNAFRVIVSLLEHRRHGRLNDGTRRHRLLTEEASLPRSADGQELLDRRCGEHCNLMGRDLGKWDEHTVDSQRRVRTRLRATTENTECGADLALRPEIDFVLQDLSWAAVETALGQPGLFRLARAGLPGGTLAMRLGGTVP
jgi:hypothetical protein